MKTEEAITLSIPFLLVIFILLAFRMPRRQVQKEVVYDTTYIPYRPYVSPWWYSDWIPYYYGPSWGGNVYSGGIRTHKGSYHPHHRGYTPSGPSGPSAPPPSGPSGPSAPIAPPSGPSAPTAPPSAPSTPSAPSAPSSSSPSAPSS